MDIWLGNHGSGQGAFAFTVYASGAAQVLPVGGLASAKGSRWLVIDLLPALLHHKLPTTIRISCVQAQGGVGCHLAPTCITVYASGAAQVLLGGLASAKGSRWLVIDLLPALLHQKLPTTIRISYVQGQGGVGCVSGCAQSRVLRIGSMHAHTGAPLLLLPPHT
jgi:hypothetical protein